MAYSTYYTKVTCKHISELTHHEIFQLDELNFGDSGLMKRTFRDYLYNLDYYKEHPRTSFLPHAYCFFVKSKYDYQIVSWAFMFPGPYSAQRDGGPWDVYIFTDYPYRRNGIGTKIIKNIRRKIGVRNMIVHPHDGPSEDFYDSLKMLD